MSNHSSERRVKGEGLKCVRRELQALSTLTLDSPLSPAPSDFHPLTQLFPAIQRHEYLGLPSLPCTVIKVCQCVFISLWHTQEHGKGKLTQFIYVLYLGDEIDLQHHVDLPFSLLPGYISQSHLTNHCS